MERTEGRTADKETAALGHIQWGTVSDEVIETNII